MTPATSPLNPFTFPLHGQRLIEASAGTGKTYTVATLYLRLVLGHGGEYAFERPLMPPEILVVTFTNAATEELRARIRRRLKEAAACFRQSDDRDADLEALRREFAPETWPELAWRLEQAAQWMDEAAIHTIHGWCRRILRQYAFDSGNLFDLSLQTQDQELIQASAADYWRNYFLDLPPSDLEWLQQLTKCSDPRQFLKRIAPLFNLTAEDLDNPFELLQERRDRMEAVRQIWQADFETAAGLIRQAQQDKTLNNQKYRKDWLNNWCNALKAWVFNTGPLPKPELLQRFSATTLTQACSRGKHPPQHAAYHAMDELVSALPVWERHIRTALLQHAAQDVARRWQVAQARRAWMGFDDLLTRLKEALCEAGGQQLAQRLRQQYPVALIDEFQDTDPIQYAIFSRIYRQFPACGLVMIGDPKQAIYAFRGADLYTYLQARRDVGSFPYTLTTNYRSTTGMVTAVNHLFGLGVQHSEGPFLFKDQIPYEWLEARGRPEELWLDGQPAPAMTFWQLPQPEPLKLGGADGFRVQMAQAAASALTGWLNAAAASPDTGFRTPDGARQPLQPADIAILVRSSTEAQIMQEALAQRDIRSVYLSDKDSVFATSEAEDILRCLQACVEPERESYLRAALATRSLGLSFAALERFNQDETIWEDTCEQFRRYRQMWRRQGVLAMLRSLLHDFNVPARLLAADGGERALTNLLHLSELLQSAAMALDSEQALIRWLGDQMADPQEKVEDQKLRLESDEDLVKVVTIHKSKGLEYPLVLLPFIAIPRSREKEGENGVRYRNTAGQWRHVFDPDETELAAADREILAEELRLLYVAVTRARYATWLGVGIPNERKKLNGRQPNYSGLLWLLASDQELTVEAPAARLAELAAACSRITVCPLPAATPDRYIGMPEAAELRPARRFTRAIPRNWWITSYSGIAAAARHSVEEPEDEHSQTTVHEAPESPLEDQLRETPPAQILDEPATAGQTATIHQFPRGAEAGTFLHDLLEWSAAQGFTTVTQHPAAVQEYLDQTLTTRGWSAWAATLIPWLNHLLETPLPLGDSSLALAQLRPEAFQPEMEFLMVLEPLDLPALDRAITAAIMPQGRRPPLVPDDPTPIEGMLKGFIDLVFEHQGRYYVLDYKSNYLGEDASAYQTPAMEQAILTHRYDIQLVFYTLALHRLLQARLPDYDYARHIGGAVYLFLRGVTAAGEGVYVTVPPQALIEKLDHASHLLS